MKNLLILYFTLLATFSQAEITQRHIITSGSGEASVLPDMAQVQMMVEARHRNISDAKNDVDGRVNRFLSAIKKLNINEKDIVASSLQLNPNYDYINQKRVFSGYRATRNLTVTLHSLEQLNDLMDTALSTGISHISPANLKSSEEETYRLKAQQNAIEDSKRKASALAKAYGAELGPIFKIEYYNSQVHQPQVETFGAARMAAVTDSSQGGQYIHDKIRFTDHINVIFDLIINE